MQPQIIEALSDGQALRLCVLNQQGDIKHKIILPDDFDVDTSVILQLYVDQDLPPYLQDVASLASAHHIVLEADRDKNWLAILDTESVVDKNTDERTSVLLPKGEYQMTFWLFDQGMLENAACVRQAYEERVEALGVAALGQARYEKAKSGKAKSIQQGCMVIGSLILTMVVASFLLPSTYRPYAIFFIAILFVCERLLFDPTKDIATLCEIEEAQLPYYYCDGIVRLSPKAFN